MLDAIETPQIVQFQHLKTQTQSCMAENSLTRAVRMQLSSVLSQLSKGVSLPLHFKMVDGVQRALKRWRRLTNMAKVATAKMMAEEVLGQTMFTSFKRKLRVRFCKENPRSERIRKWFLRFFTKRINPRSF